MIKLDPRYLEMVKIILKKTLPDYPVFAFGSRTTTTFKPHSDLDLCVIGEQPLSLMQIAALKEAFSESDLPIRVDIVDWNALSPEFRQAIKNQLTQII